MKITLRGCPWQCVEAAVHVHDFTADARSNAINMYRTKGMGNTQNEFSHRVMQVHSCSVIHYLLGEYPYEYRIAPYIWLGKGKPASVRLDRIGISPAPNKIPDLMTIINTAGIGVTTVNLKVPYSTAQDSNIARIYLGNITLQITGQVTRNTSGSLKFTGIAKAFSDRYDANVSNHRAVFDEKATTALRQVGRVARAQDYEIKITGELPINFSR